MIKDLRGREVSDALNRQSSAAVQLLRQRGVTPKLAIVRCGENPSDLAYETGAAARAEALGIEAELFHLPEDVTEDALRTVLRGINADHDIHGCLMLRPLPKQLAAVQDDICNLLAAEKDVDGMTAVSAAGVFSGRPLGFAPCTAQACMEILRYYGVDCAGKRAVIIGRSLVVGRPLAMLLLQQNATVTVCHTHTKALAEVAREADILVSAAGSLGLVTRDFVRPGQIVLDVAINWDKDKPNAKGGHGALAGDAAYDEVFPTVGAISPVPGGVGLVTTSVLLSHVVIAAQRSAGQ